MQALYSALKVPLLLLATVGLSLPSFFILNTLLGLRDDFGTRARAIAASQAGLTVILVALAPLTAVLVRLDRPTTTRRSSSTA